MAKEKSPKEKEPSLEDRLLGVSTLTDLTKGLNKAKKPGEQAEIYERAARLMGGEDYETALKELTRDPAYAYLEIIGTRDKVAKSLEEEYLANKETIATGIKAKIDASLKQVGDNKANASMLLANYLADILIEVPEFSQDEVDEPEKQRVYSMGMPYAFEARGSTAHYRNLEMREQASEYLKEVKEGDKVRYEIDYKKLSEAMNDVVKGASLYTRVKAIEKIKEKAIEKAKKK